MRMAWSLNRRRHDAVTPDLSGRKFGRLVVERMAARRARCRCDCGSIIVVPPSSLLDGKRVSCGCLSRERSANRVRIARPRAVRQSLDTAWADAKTSAERSEEHTSELQS